MVSETPSFLLGKMMFYTWKVSYSDKISEVLLRLSVKLEVVYLDFKDDISFCLKGLISCMEMIFSTFRGLFDAFEMPRVCFWSISNLFFCIFRNSFPFAETPSAFLIGILSLVVCLQKECKVSREVITLT